jgi:hypothetical protein
MTVYRQKAQVARKMWMAVEVGFEPTEELPPHTLSRRAPLAARTLHRRSGYPTTAVTTLREPTAQDLGALVGENVRHDLRPVVEPPVAYDVPQRTDRPRLRVGSAIDHRRDAAEHQRAGTHRAGFECHHQGAAVQPPAADGTSRLA